MKIAQRVIKEFVALALIFGFFQAYRTIPPLKNGLDAIVTPAVGGITLVYGKITSLLYGFTGIDLGFVTPKPDSDFLYQVRLATYVNEREAAPLFEIASDTRLPREKRELALMAVEKFDSPVDWIDSFLNELPKGGLLRIQNSNAYDVETPIHDELIRRIRAAGGIRKTLVRAYAEVVFSFMLQHPTEKELANHALRWLPDVLAEDAVFLIIPRLGEEKEPKTQEAIEKALLEIRAISDPQVAQSKLFPHYRFPDWPGLKFPLAVVLARLGQSSPVDYLMGVKADQLTPDQQIALRLGIAQTPYPRVLRVSPEQEKLWAERNRVRESQLTAAVEKQRQQRLKEKVKKMLAENTAEKTPETKSQTPPAPPAVAVVPPPPAPEPAASNSVPVKSQPVSKPVPVAATKPVKKEGKPASLVSLPPADKEVTPPPAPELPAEEIPTQAEIIPEKRSVMSRVDQVFEAKDGDVDLYENPGDKESKATLKKGAKGKAVYEALVANEQWVEVRTKDASGWTLASNLLIFNLSPESGAKTQPQAANAPPRESPPRPMGGQKYTYFEVSGANVSYYDGPNEVAGQKGTLKEGVRYKAILSEKNGPDRWFLLEVPPEDTGWVRGVDIHLAEDRPELSTAE